MAQLHNRLAEGRIQSIRLPHVGTLLLAGVIVILMAVVAYALQHEFARQPGGTIAAPAASAVPARALSAEEEAYAAALWPIHRDVKLAALGMTFAGITYKTDSPDRVRLATEVEPLSERFKAAIANARALEVPASLREVHERYLAALASYEGTLLLVTHDRRMLDAVHVTRRLRVDAGRVTED